MISSLNWWQKSVYRRYLQHDSEHLYKLWRYFYTFDSDYYPKGLYLFSPVRPLLSKMGFASGYQGRNYWRWCSKERRQRLRALQDRGARCSAETETASSFHS